MNVQTLMTQTVILYRPVGAVELKLIEEVSLERSVG